MLRRGEPIEASDIVNSELIRRLSEQRVTLRAQLAEQSSTLLDGHPRIKELKAQIADLDQQIRGEAERLVRSLENDAKLAGARVEALSANLDQLKRQAASTNEQDVQLRALEREAKAQRDLLESYLAKYREATARDSIGAAPADARIISRAIVSNTPYFPKKLPIILVAMFATLVRLRRVRHHRRVAAPLAAPGSGSRCRSRPTGCPRGRRRADPSGARRGVHAIDEFARSLRGAGEGGGRASPCSAPRARSARRWRRSRSRARWPRARVVLVDLALGAPTSR